MVLMCDRLAIRYHGIVGSDLGACSLWASSAWLQRLRGVRILHKNPGDSRPVPDSFVQKG